MMFFKTKFFIFIVLISIVATFYYFGDTKKLSEKIIPKLKATPLSPAVEKLETLDALKLTKDFQASVKNAETEIANLSERTKQVGQHTSKVLGTSVQSASDDQAVPIHEKALEYGKYIYCKQVVTDYETLNPSIVELN